MKLWIAPALALLFLSGCNSTKKNVQLQNKNAQQALLIQQQQAKIETLNKRLGKHQPKKRSARRSSTLPPEPKKNIKLKKVEDSNFNSEYMYPQTKSKTKKVETLAQATSTGSSMTKESCITMIGEDKFNKYTQMFGNEAASIKRCAMLKVMKN